MEDKLKSELGENLSWLGFGPMIAENLCCLGPKYCKIDEIDLVGVSKYAASAKIASLLSFLWPEIMSIALRIVCILVLVCSD